MAVRDEERQAITVGRAKRGVPWRDAFGVLAPILAVSAILLYAYLAICYERFYGSLGVDPADVGLSYTGTLAHSPGFVAFFLLFATALAGCVRFFYAPRYRRARTQGHPLAFLWVVAIFLLAVVVPGFAVALYQSAGEAATNVWVGKAVAPIRVDFPPYPAFPLLAIHADPATVEPAGKPQDTPAAERLRTRKFLYIGQAEGTMVLYDSAAQQAVYVPAGSVILHVANCRAKPPLDPSCQHVYSGWRLRWR